MKDAKHSEDEGPSVAREGDGSAAAHHCQARLGKRKLKQAKEKSEPGEAEDAAHLLQTDPPLPRVKQRAGGIEQSTAVFHYGRQTLSASSPSQKSRKSDLVKNDGIFLGRRNIFFI